MFKNLIFKTPQLFFKAITLFLLTFFLMSACMQSDHQSLVTATTTVEMTMTNKPVNTPTISATKESPTPTAITTIETALNGTITSDLGVVTSALPTATNEPMSNISVTQNIKIAYAIQQQYDESLKFQIYVADFSDSIPHPLISTQSENPWLSSSFAWSNDGQMLAYAYLGSSNYVDISIVDMSSFEDNKLENAIHITTESRNLEFVGLNGWSLDDEWIAVTIGYSSLDISYWEETTLLNIYSGEQLKLDLKNHFMAWSSSSPNRYLYILHPSHPELGEESLNLGEIGHNDPIYSISDFDGYFPLSALSLSPDDLKVILVARRGTSSFQEENLLVDFQEGEWSLLANPSDNRSIPFQWSPDGQWVVYFQREGLQFRSMQYLNQPMVSVESMNEYPVPLVWLPDSSGFIYQDGDELFVVSPMMPKDPTLIFNLAALGILSDFEASVKLWIPTN